MEKLLQVKDEAFSGWGRLNDTAVRWAAYATSLALTKMVGSSARIVIGCQASGGGNHAAEQAALVFARHGQQVIWLKDTLPRPIVSFAVQQFEASAGIFITEEKTTPRSFRFSLIGSDGNPHPDESIRIVQEEMAQLDQDVTIETMPNMLAQQKGLLQPIGSEIMDHYIQAMHAKSIRKKHENHSKLHILLGASTEKSNVLTKKLLEQAQFHVTEFISQQEDVASPITNNVMIKEAVQHAKLIGADVVLFMAGDGERIAIAVKNTDGEFVRLSGQQTGALLLEYVFSIQQQRGTLPQEAILLKSITTSDLYRKIAAAYGVHTTNVLHASKQMDGSSYMFLYSTTKQGSLQYEDLLSNNDGIQKSLILCEMAAAYQAEGRSIYEKLQEIYQKYGYYKESCISIALNSEHEANDIERIMNRFRTTKFEKVGTKKLWRKSDFFPEANIVKYHLDNDAWIIFAPSSEGTELGIWFSVTGTNAQGCQFVITSLKHDIIHHLYEFEETGQY